MARFQKIAPLITRTLALAIGALFIYAGVAKALDPALFAGDIAKFQLIPWHPSVLLALYLPWLEILCGCALVFRRLYRGSTILLALLCLMFLGALTSAKMRGLDISCGCFGHSTPHPLALSMLFDSLLLAALVFLITMESRRLCKQPQGREYTPL